MMRRAFISLFGTLAVAMPVAVYSQQPALPVVGFIHTQSADSFAHLAAAVRDGLGEAGYVEGENVTIEYRWADGQLERVPGLTADLVDRQVAVIVTQGAAATLAVRAATSTIPIVFATMGSDPVELGIVSSFSRPGGNVTGVYGGDNPTTMETKRLGLLLDLVPQAARIAVLLYPGQRYFEAQLAEISRAAAATGQQVQIVTAASDGEIDAAFATIAHSGAGGLLVGVASFFNSRRDQIVALAASLGIPAIYERREFALAGGLMSYGDRLTDSYRQAGVYAGRILNGESPADLPLWPPSRFEFVINLRTAAALGLDVPPALLARADEVIE